MKFKIYRVAFAGALLFSAAALVGNEPSSASARLSDPSKPSVIRFYIGDGSLKVIGTDSPDVITVESDAQPDGQTVTRPDGLRVIGGGGTFSLTEDHNVVELKYGRESLPGGVPGNFTVQVPKAAAIELKNGWNTEVQVTNVCGDVEIKNINGSVRLDNLSGGAVVETINGEIRGSFVGEPMNKSLSFTSVNGRVELHLPSTAKANVRFRTQNGSILTDFSDDVLKTKSEPMNVTRHRVKVEINNQIQSMVADEEKRANKISESGGEIPEAPEAPEAPERLEIPAIPAIPAVVGGRVVAGTLNGGGVEIQIATMNGDIVVRKQTGK